MYLLEAPKNIAREDRFDQAQFIYKNLAIKPKRSITTFYQVFFKIKKRAVIGVCPKLQEL